MKRIFKLFKSIFKKEEQYAPINYDGRCSCRFKEGIIYYSKLPLYDMRNQIIKKQHTPRGFQYDGFDIYLPKPALDKINKKFE